MAVQNKSKSIININCPDNCKNKVYINPNFNRHQINNLHNNAIMHVNPKFSHLVSNVQCNILNKNKIYVNPNFIKSKSVSDNKQYSASASVYDSVIISDKQKAVNISNSMFTYQQQSVAKEVSALQVPIAQSRYCLVRQDVTNKILKESVPEKANNTFKLNKYKSVPWNDIKRKLDNSKNTTNSNSTLAFRIETNSNTLINKKKPCPSVLNENKNEFFINNYNNVSFVKQDRIKTKVYIDVHKKVYKSNQMNQSNEKKMKGNLKKNNIPCRLFRKFGKCLRNVRGRCEFLHDKKHVTICRKFIKGLCHDKDCLLSHDLTTKKMPTCYFYLQGTCTKTDCPYLHVKLNEKAKVCPDFLKGYCEKGSKCLQRHINVPTEKKNKRKAQMTKASSRNKYNELKRSINNINNFDRQDGKVFQNNEIKSDKFVIVKSENYSEHRYYQEDGAEGTTNETCEIIKPMRCKLGTLPSFIQL